MGCDIHIAIQVRDGDRWTEIPWQRVWRFLPPVAGFPVAPDGFTDRNYDLFGILANVRNGTGFAGIKTGEGWAAIAPNRGLPSGFDPETVAPDPMWPDEGPRYMGDHSWTWIDLVELKAIPWDSIASSRRGVLEWTEWRRWRKEGGVNPRSWSGDVSGPGVIILEEYQAICMDERGVEAAKIPGLGHRHFVRCSWGVTARQATNDWPGKVLPWLEELAANRSLRLVLGFDS